MSIGVSRSDGPGGVGRGPGPEVESSRSTCGRRGLHPRGGRARLSSPAVSATDSLTANAVDVLPAGELEKRLARRGRPLRVKLGIDPTAPVVTLGHAVVLTTLRAFQDAGPHGRADRRRLHGARRRSQRPLEGPADAHARGDRAQRPGAARRVRARDRPRARRGAPQLRVARAARHRRPARARGAHHGRAPARARRLREAARGARADLAAGAALPAPAGLRLGRDPRRRRARRHRSEVQPADGSRPAGVVRAGAADRLHAAAARRAPTACTR